jgi:hypothetical protein
MIDQAKTIRNPMPRDNVRAYTVTLADGSSREVKAIGGTNAWFMSRIIWPDQQIASIEESVPQ